MWLVTSRCPRIRAPKLKHAAWQNGASTLAPGSARARSLGVLSPRKVDGTRAEGPRVLQLALHKVQHTNPGPACSPDKAKSGCWAPQADRDTRWI